jgi:PmbA protein
VFNPDKAAELYDFIRRQLPDASPLEVFISEGRQFDTEVRNQQVETLEFSSGFNLKVVFALQNRKTSFSTNDIDKASVTSMIDFAKASVQYSDADPYYKLPEPAQLGQYDGDLDLVDPSYENADNDQIIADLKELEEIALTTEPDFISDGASAAISKHTGFYLSSAGFSGQSTRTSFRKHLGLVANDPGAGENSGRRQSSGYLDSQTYFSDLMDNTTLAAKAIDYTRRKLGARKPASGSYPVIFSPEMTRSILRSLESAASGHAIYNNASFLKDKTGQKLAPDFVSIEDNPLLPRRKGSFYHDAEGFKPTAFYLLENGVFQTYLLSTYSAAKLGLQSNGRKGGSGNLILQPGPYSEDALIKTIQKGIYITELSGQGVNIVNGDYSRGAQGLMIENGALTYPVSEFTVNSNLLTMLSDIEMIANNTDWRSAYVCPSVRIAKMQIGGK